MTKKKTYTAKIRKPRRSAPKVSMNQRIECHYGLVCKWALSRYGIQDSLDYVHTAITKLLETSNTRLSDKALLGQWRVLIHDAYCKEQVLRKNLSGYDIAELATDESRFHARQWIKRLLPGLSKGQRALIYHLALRGETYEDVGAQLGIAASSVFTLYQRVLTDIGTRLQRENDALSCADVFLPV